MDYDYFSDESNKLQVSHYEPQTEDYDSDSSISYADEFEKEPTEFEDILLDGLIADNYTAEYLKKIKDLEIQLKEKASSGYFRCKIKDVKVYK